MDNNKKKQRRVDEKMLAVKQVNTNNRIGINNEKLLKSIEKVQKKHSKVMKMLAK